MWVGAVIAAVLGAALSAVAFWYRVRGVFFAVITLSSVEVFRGLFSGWEFLGGTSGIFLISANDPADMNFLSRIPYYEIILGMVVLAGAAKPDSGFDEVVSRMSLGLPLTVSTAPV